MVLASLLFPFEFCPPFPKNMSQAVIRKQRNVNLDALFDSQDLIGIQEYCVELDAEEFYQLSFRLLHFLLQKKELKIASQVWKRLNLNPNDAEAVLACGYSMLALSYLLAKKQHQDAIQLYLSMSTFDFADRKLDSALQSRHLLILLLHLFEQKEFDHFSSLVQVADRKFLNADMLNLTLALPSETKSDKESRFHALTQFVGRRLQASPLAAVDFRLESAVGIGLTYEAQRWPDHEISQLKQIVATKARSTCKNQLPELKEEHQYVVDVGNVLHYGRRRVTVESYRRLLKLVESLPRQQLLISHPKHFSMRGKHWSASDCEEIKVCIEAIKNRTTIIKTTKSVPDDWWLLYAAVQSFPAKLVTNDQFRDHFPTKHHQSFLFRDWYNSYCLGFTYNEETCIAKLVKSRQPELRILQVEDKKILIPIVNQKEWIVVQ